MKIITLITDQEEAYETCISAFIAAMLDKNNIKINYLKLNTALSV